MPFSYPNILRSLRSAQFCSTHSHAFGLHPTDYLLLPGNLIAYCLGNMIHTLYECFFAHFINVIWQ